MKERIRNLLLAAALLAPLTAAGQSIAPLQETFESDRAALESAIAAFEVARARWDEVTAEIETLRRRVVADPMSGFALPDAMRDAHTVAAELSALDAQMRLASRRLDESMRALRDAASARVVSIDAAVSNAGGVASTQVAELAEMQQLLDTLDDPALRYVPVPLDAILGALDDTSEELRAAADELADHETRLARQLAEVEVGIERARARERLEERVSALAFEERFFDDGGFRRAAPSGSGGSPRAESDAATGDDQATAGNSDGGAVSAPGTNEPGRGGATDSAGSPNPAPEEGGAEAPDGDFSTPPSMPVLDLEPIVPNAPNGGRVVEASAYGADPTLRGLSSTSSEIPARRRGRSRTEDLEGLQRSLVRDIETLRAQRTALEAQAEVLERNGF